MKLIYILWMWLLPAEH